MTGGWFKRPWLAPLGAGIYCAITARWPYLEEPATGSATIRGVQTIVE
jgi:hypothetical protein